MVDVAVRRGLVRVAIQAVGRVGARGDGRYDFWSRAVVTGGAGTGPVGGDIMLSALDLRPGRDHMTGAAGNPVRQVTAAQANGMGMS